MTEQNDSQATSSRLDLGFTLISLDALCLFLAPLAGGAGNYMALFFSSTLHWDTKTTGILLAIMSVSIALTQIPAGVLIDKTTQLKQIIIGALSVLALAWLSIIFYPNFYTVAAAQIFIGASCALFMPAMASVSLGLVGLKNFDIRLGRNGVFSHAGNVITAILVVLFIAKFGVGSILFLFIVFAILAIASAMQINNKSIDYSYLRKQNNRQHIAHPLLGGFASLLASKTARFFTVAALFYAFADAAMLPLMVQRIGHIGSRLSSMHVPIALCLTEFVMIPVCYIAGRRAYLGRKPLLILSYIFLFLRGLCFSLTGDSNILVGLQVLDGISAGIFGLMLTLVISDLSIDSGRFNATLTTMGVLFTLTNGISSLVFGFATERFGYSLAFDIMAACAVFGGLLIWFFVPETVKAKV